MSGSSKAINTSLRHLVIKRYGFLFGPPSRPNLSQFWEPTTLLHRLASFAARAYKPRSRPPDLGERFRIAMIICPTVLQLHASDWFHGNIRSSSFLFFPPASGLSSFFDFNLSNPVSLVSTFLVRTGPMPLPLRNPKAVRLTTTATRDYGLPPKVVRHLGLLDGSASCLPVRLTWAIVEVECI